MKGPLLANPSGSGQLLSVQPTNRTVELTFNNTTGLWQKTNLNNTLDLPRFNIVDPSRNYNIIWN